MTIIDHLNPPTGRMADNVVGFARTLRAAGLPVGPAAVIDAMNALQRDRHRQPRGRSTATLQAVFVKRHEHALIFAQAFELFFRPRERLEAACWTRCRCRTTPGRSRRRPRAASRRRCVAAADARASAAGRRSIEMRLSVSDQRGAAEEGFRADERGRDRRSDAADREHGAAAAELRTRRFRPIAQGLSSICAARCAAACAPAARSSISESLGRIDKPAPIVALLDISGSMSEYTRLFLHFLHALTDERKRVSVFLFGTRLTNVTRALRAARSRRGAGELFGGGARTGPAARGSRPRCTIQPAVGPPRAGAGRHRAADHRRAGARADAKLAFEMDRLHRPAAG